MQKELHDAGAVAVQVSFEIENGLVAPFPEAPSRSRRVWQPFTVQDLRMHSHDKHFLVIGPIEDADPPALGQAVVRPPEEVVIQFLGTRLFETEYLAALRVHA